MWTEPFRLRGGNEDERLRANVCIFRANGISSKSVNEVKEIQPLSQNENGINLLSWKPLNSIILAMQLKENGLKHFDLFSF